MPNLVLALGEEVDFKALNKSTSIETRFFTKYLLAIVNSVGIQLAN
jgi:hypothetical protein